jgi:predicted MFS family arabinose efflux permease
MTPVLANRKKMRIHATLIGAFVCGGFLGALGFKHWGYQSTLILALLLTGLSILPLFDDARARMRLFNRHIKHPD